MLEGNREFSIFMQAIANNCRAATEKHVNSLEGSEYLRGQIFSMMNMLDTIDGARANLERAKAPKT